MRESPTPFTVFPLKNSQKYLKRLQSGPEYPFKNDNSKSRLLTSSTLLHPMFLTHFFFFPIHVQFHPPSPSIPVKILPPRELLVATGQSRARSEEKREEKVEEKGKRSGERILPSLPGPSSSRFGSPRRRKQVYLGVCINTVQRCRCKVDTEHTCYVPGRVRGPPAGGSPLRC